MINLSRNTPKKRKIGLYFRELITEQTFWTRLETLGKETIPSLTANVVSRRPTTPPKNLSIVNVNNPTPEVYTNNI